MIEANGSETLKIKKSDLWKYSTFILAAVLIVGAIVFFTGNNNTGTGTGGTGNVVQNTEDFSFADDSTLYPFVGPKDAKVTVIAFYDFQCPWCAIASGLPSFAQQYASQYADVFGIDKKLKQLAESGKIKLVFGTMSFLGSESGYAAEAFLSANEQGKAIEMYELIFSAHNGKENNGQFSKDNLKKIAQKIDGLDQAKFADSLDSGKYASKVSILSSNANGAGVTGTPTFVINGQATSASWTKMSTQLQGLGVKV